MVRLGWAAPRPDGTPAIRARLALHQRDAGDQRAHGKVMPRPPAGRLAASPAHCTGRTIGGCRGDGTPSARPLLPPWLQHAAAGWRDDTASASTQHPWECVATQLKLLMTAGKAAGLGSAVRTSANFIKCKTSCSGLRNHHRVPDKAAQSAASPNWPASTSAKLDHLAGELSGILSFVRQLAEVDTTGVPLSSVADLTCPCAPTWSPTAAASPPCWPTPRRRDRGSRRFLPVPKVVE